MVILSAKHGFVAPDDTLDPYDLRMTTARADELLARLDQSITQVAWPRRASRVLLAGGQTYRRVMRAAIGLVGAPHLPIEEVCGGIGYQRSQLANFLAEQGRPALADQIGSHPNGQPLYRRYGVYAVGDSVLFNDPGPGRLALKRAVLRELFDGPAGPLHVPTSTTRLPAVRASFPGGSRSPEFDAAPRPWQTAPLLEAMAASKMR
ncbi:DUF6884 domain-containing protein (plasmid) [Cupriavidus basilensis]